MLCLGLGLGLGLSLGSEGTMMNSPCMPCPSDNLTHMYSPLYFATHVHNIQL